LTFTPDDWHLPQPVHVSYQASGDSQFKLTSSDYFIFNGNQLQFSTCACKVGEHCPNACQEYCTTGESADMPFYIDGEVNHMGSFPFTEESMSPHQIANQHEELARSLSAI
jgi:hypothetical protein